jgi:anti-sigma B factor antagonist
MPLELGETQSDNVKVVSIVGSLDALTAPELGAFIEKQLAAGFVNLVADLAGLAYTSSAGLRVLLNTVKETRQRGGDLRLAAIQEKVNEVLDLSGFTSILKCYTDVEQAVASFM